jgi:putative membrane protein
MQDARRFLTAEEQQAVRDVVADAEKKTSAEIVCALATESGRYDRAEGLAGLAFALLGLAAAHAVYVVRLQAEGSWVTAAAVPFVWQCVAVSAGFLVGNVLASYVHPIRRLFTSRGEMQAETWRAAQYVFASRGLWRTEGRGGLVLYISLSERMAVVLADKGVLTQLKAPFLDRLRDAAVAELRQGRRVEPFTRTIGLAVESLAAALPVRPGDRDELHNDLVVYHPRP